MALESNGYGVGEYWLWCWKAKVMMFESKCNGVMMLKSNDRGAGE
jgi:hypothetical protein